MRSWLLGACLALLFVAGGCTRAGYYLQSVNGQLDLMARRVPIDELVADPGTPDRLRERLETVTGIRDFASRGLGLPDNRSYRTYADLERPYVVWNVFAAPEFSVEAQTWCFLFVGCVAYRGYFSEERARAYADELRAEGFDVYVAGIAAYSTLGRFADPVLNTMLVGDDLYLANLIFHELAHQQLYVKDASMFNESFATLVGEEGVRRWLAGRDEPEAWERWQQRERFREQFTALVTATRAQLAGLYASGADATALRAGKREIVAQLREAYAGLRAEWGGYAGYDPWFAGPLNNAQIGSVATYQLLVPAFRALLAASDGDMATFYRRAEALGALSPAERDRAMRRLAGAGVD